jgi:hypothetical protein
MECELPKFYDYSEPIARKNHVCCECDAPILKGEKHFHGRGKWSYGVESYRQHLACMEACILIRDEFNDFECIGFGTLKEEFEELRGDRTYFQDRKPEPWKRLRSFMAQILIRERKHRAGMPQSRE